MQSAPWEKRRSGLDTLKVMHVVVPKTGDHFWGHAVPSCGQWQFAITRLINPTNVFNL
jgi:hypothetical protein